jgi:hypothetical protein
MFRQMEAPRYTTAIWINISSHALMIVLVGACTLLFWLANRRQRKGKGLIESAEGFRYTYQVDRLIACDELMHWEIAFAEPGRALPVAKRSNIKFQGIKTLMNESCECPHGRHLVRGRGSWWDLT